jgi:hypothetical protein
MVVVPALYLRFGAIHPLLENDGTRHDRAVANLQPGLNPQP